MDICEAMEQVKDRETFLVFLKRLAGDFTENHEAWENRTIDTYLESISAWMEDTDENENTPLDYHRLAEIFYVGKIYE